MVGISVDITDRKKAELGELAAQVAHDIRSPLQLLDVLSHDLKKRFSDDKSRTFTDAIRRIHDIATDLLERYRKNKTNETNEMNETNEAMAIEKAYPLWLVLLKLIDEKRFVLATQHPDITLTLEPTDDHTLSAIVEIAEIQRILSNLINNAIEAFLGIEKADKHITLKLSAVDSKVLIEVTDNGKGISAERVAKFNDAKGIETRGGHGLGLTHACDTIGSWQGSIEMTSTVGQGTTIKISLPLSSPPLWLQLYVSITSETLVYLVDDDKITLFRLKDILIKKGIAASQIRAYEDITEFLADYQIAKAEAKDIFIFMDQIITTSKKLGIDILIENELVSHAVLITNDIFDNNLQQRLNDNRIRLLPKPLFTELMVEVKSPHTDEVEYVVLDDLEMVTDFWNLEALSQGIAVRTFNNSKDFMRFIERCDKNVKIYLDNDIRENITGIEISKKLSDMGFTTIYMMTSRDDINLTKYPWIKDVVTKGGPFDEQ
ncbi:MAG: hybrid sensor histidine kinase/response regulator, partial [Gammaproteobacteria bacterium]|nr:hybrid sensor histidine kinase/response regulator [Gammaproteobacteria bacterium]